MSKLAEAKQLLAERGRTWDGDLESKDGCLCPLGALALAYNGESGEGPMLYLDRETDLEEYNRAIRLVQLAYTPVDLEHQADILALSYAAEERGIPRVVDLATYSPAERVYLFNDRRDGHVFDDEVLALFDQAQGEL